MPVLATMSTGEPTLVTAAESILRQILRHKPFALNSVKYIFVG
jgi:hypothetical protein